MSAFIVWCRENEIVIISDGAVYPGRDNVTMSGLQNKVMLFPHFNGAAVVRGQIGYLLQLVQARGQKWTSFDHAMIEFGQDAADAAQMFKNRHGEIETEIVFCGYSEARERFESYSLTVNTAEQDEVILSPIPAIYWGPDVEQENAEGHIRIKDGNMLIDTVEDLYSLMECQRLTPQPFSDDPADMHHCVGGFMQKTVITRDKITTEIVRRWPDELGKPIDPTIKSVAVSTHGIASE